MDVLSFRWRAKYGHFLRAEANRSALSYPLPPRTAVLGLIAAILGLEKDALALDLRDARVAIAGEAPQRFWHRIKLRKDPPTALSLTVKRSQKGSDKPEKATLVLQEWLLKPDFLVHLALPEQPDRFAELVERMQKRRWHFTPCMGLSELLADVVYVDCRTAQPQSGEVLISGACPASDVRLRSGEGLGIHLLRMPHSVTADRVFHHIPYYIEHLNRPFWVETESAWRINDQHVVLS